MKAEVEIGVMQPQAKEHQRLQAATRSYGRDIEQILFQSL